jgi:hypothetical protein
MRRTILLLAMSGLMLIALTGGAWAYSETDYDTWLGLNAAASLPAGTYGASFIGSYAGLSNIDGYGNSFVGRSAGYYNTTGYKNSIYGADAGFLNTTGYENTFIGAGAGHDNTTGYFNSFIGKAAGQANTTGFNNTFLGKDAGYYNSEGHENTFIGVGAGHDNTTGYYNSFIGIHAGTTNTTGYLNTFVGAGAGYHNTIGDANTFIGYGAGNNNSAGDGNSFIGQYAGAYNTTGLFNSFMGQSAGSNNTTGSYNTNIGNAAGSFNSTGSGNVFLGHSAGGSETGSNKLYIDNCLSGFPCTDPFIYGEFDNRILKLDGALGIGTRPAYGVDVSGVGVSESQLHFSLAGTDTGGWVTSVADNNFWLSSGAVWDQAGGGWVQKSTDQKAVMAGSGPAGYRVLTRSGCPVGAANPPTSRMTIDYSGNVGFGITPTYPLHMASGARVTVGGMWIDASSRDYKEDIQELSAAAAISTLQGLNPVTFKYKAGENERHVGFIAEDVPELVASQDRKGMGPMDVVAVLTKVVKEQQEINRELMQKLTGLETEVQRLRESGADGRLARIAH